MSKIKLLSKLDLAVIEKNNGKKTMPSGIYPLNELVEAVNRLEEKMAADHDDRGE